MKKSLYTLILGIFLPLQCLWADVVTIDLRKYSPEKFILVDISDVDNGTTRYVVYVDDKSILGMKEIEQDLSATTEFHIIGDPNVELKGQILVAGGIVTSMPGIPGFPINVTLENVHLSGTEEYELRDAFRLQEQRQSGSHVKLTLKGENYLEGTEGKKADGNLHDNKIGGSGIAVGYAKIKDARYAYDDKHPCSIEIGGPGTLTAIGGLGCAGIGASGGAMGYEYSQGKNWLQGHYCGHIIINSGTIIAKGGYEAAAIGDSYCGGRSRITINGGDITAGPGKSGMNVTGIGMGRSDRGGIINLNGGNINVTGQRCAVGIGTGLFSGVEYYDEPTDNPREINISGEVNIIASIIDESSFNFTGSAIGYGTASYSNSEMTIRITGGNIVANSYSVAPAIGTGGISDSLSGRGRLKIEISGGKISATGGAGNPGIGRSVGSTAPTIYIEGNPEIEATGGEGGAGIGDCQFSHADDTEKNNFRFKTNITISGNPIIKATGGIHAAGIGGGNNAVNGDISINGGQITAIGGRDPDEIIMSGAGIGSGTITNKKDEANVGWAPGEITINSPATVYAAGGAFAAGIGGGAGFGTGRGNDTSHTIKINGGTVEAAGWMAAGIGDGIGIVEDGDKYKLNGNYDDYMLNPGVSKVFISGGAVYAYGYFKYDENWKPEVESLSFPDTKAAAGYPKDKYWPSPFENMSKSVYPGIALLHDAQSQPIVNTTLSATDIGNVSYNMEGITTGSRGHFYCYLPSTEPGLVFGSISHRDTDYMGYYKVEPGSNDRFLAIFTDGKRRVNGYGKDIHIYEKGFRLVARGEKPDDQDLYQLGIYDALLITGNSGDDNSYIHIHSDYKGYNPAAGFPIELGEYWGGSDEIATIIADAPVRLTLTGTVSIKSHDGIPGILAREGGKVDITGDGYLVARGGSGAPAIETQGTGVLQISDGIVRLFGGDGNPAVRSANNVGIDGGSIIASGGSGAASDWDAPALVNKKGMPLRPVMLNILYTGLITDIENGYIYGKRPRLLPYFNSELENISGVYNSSGEKIIHFDTKTGYSGPLPEYWIGGVRLAEMIDDGCYTHCFYLPLDEGEYRLMAGLGNRPYENTADISGLFNLYPHIQVQYYRNNLSIPQAEWEALPATAGMNTTLALPQKTYEGFPVSWYTDKECTSPWTALSRLNTENGVKYQNGAFTVGLYAAVSCHLSYHANGAGGTPPEPFDGNMSVPAKAAAPGDLAMDGYYFESWNTEPGGTGTRYKPGDAVKFDKDNTDIILYAQWQEKTDIATVGLTAHTATVPVYNGQPHTPLFTLTDDQSALLKEGEDYTLTGYGNNTKASGKAEIYIEGTGRYKGRQTVFFTIDPLEITLDGTEIKDKPQDGTPTGQVSKRGTLGGILGNDEVAVDWSAADVLFATTGIGEDIPVYLSGLALTGANATDYRLVQPIELKGNIIPRQIPPAGTYRNFTIEAFEGAEPSPRRGVHNVTEGDAFTIYFDVPEGYQSGDLQVTLDGKEIAHRQLYGNRYVVVVNRIQSDHLLRIGKKGIFTVTMPQQKGAATDPAAGTHHVGRFDPFVFTLHLEDAYDLSQPTVLVNGNELAAQTPAPLRAATHTYRIDSIRENIRIEILDIWRNDGVANEHITPGEPLVYTAPGHICIETVKETPATVYTLTGVTHIHRRLTPGLNRLPLQAGIYILRIEGKSWKVIVKE